MDAPDWVIGQAGEHAGEPSLQVDVVELGSGDQLVDGGGTPAVLVGPGEGLVLVAHGDGTHLAFGSVVGHAKAAIIEEARECRPTGEAIGDGLGGLALAGELGALLAQPGSSSMTRGSYPRRARPSARVGSGH